VIVGTTRLANQLDHLRRIMGRQAAADILNLLAVHATDMHDCYTVCGGHPPPHTIFPALFLLLLKY
jgi:hypothetical protein